jgi:hypothetical protein
VKRTAEIIRWPLSANADSAELLFVDKQAAPTQPGLLKPAE